MFIKKGNRYTLISVPTSIHFSPNHRLNDFLTNNFVLQNVLLPRMPTSFSETVLNSPNGAPFSLDAFPSKQENVALVSLQLPNRISNLCKDACLRSIDGSLRRGTRSFSEINEQHPDFIIECVDTGRYYNRRLVLNTELIDYHPVHAMRIKHKTDNYISPYSETVINNFKPSDDQGFIELEVDASSSFTRNIASQMLLNNDFTRYDSQPSRKYQSTYASDVVIDSFNEFSYISDELKDQLIEAIGPRKIKAFEIENFYRGSTPARATITEVRSNKIVKGNFVFPVIIKSNVLNQETLEYEPKKILVFALFRSWERVIRYSKSREFIVSLLEDLSYADGLKFFDPEAYERKMKELYGTHVEYWSGITSIWQGNWETAGEPVETINETSVNATHMAKTFGYESIKNSPQTIEFQEIDKAYQHVEEKVSNSTSSIERFDREIKALQRQKRDLEQRIRSQEEYIAQYQNNLDQSVKDLAAASEAKRSMDDEYIQAKEAYQQYVSAVSDNYDGALNWLNNMSKSGIVVEDIHYHNSSDYETKSITEDPSLPVQALQGKTWKLHSIRFRTTKPVIIYVDRGSRGDSCKKIVGGPYNITITQSDISISLQSSKACFGNDGTKIWVHPHTNYLTTRVDGTWKNFTRGFVNVPTRGCLGEASPIFYNAFKKNDIKTAIFGAMTWVTSANSTDTWGKHYKYFPKLSEVNLESSTSSDVQEEAEVELTEERIEVIAEGLAMMVEEQYPEVTTTTNIVDQIIEHVETNDDDTPEETNFEAIARVWAETAAVGEPGIVHTPTTNEAEAVQEDQEIQEENPNLRHAGIRGYRPYGT